MYRKEFKQELKKQFLTGKFTENKNLITTKQKENMNSKIKLTIVAILVSLVSFSGAFAMTDTGRAFFTSFSFTTIEKIDEKDITPEMKKSMEENKIITTTKITDLNGVNIENLSEKEVRELLKKYNGGKQFETTTIESIERVPNELTESEIKSMIDEHEKNNKN